VKVIRPDQVNDRSALRGLRREADALERVRHPVVIRLLDSDFDGPRPHIVLELAEGPRLSTDLRRFGRLDVDQTALLAVELSSALHSMHRAGLLHLDVKPKNLILGAPPRLIDLSIARSIDDAARLKRPIGTDAYMAPEQVLPGVRGVVGPAADVWGLGVTLFESATGELPFPRGVDEPDATVAERFPQLDVPPLAVPRDVAPEIAEAIHGALEPEPVDRPAPREIANLIEPLLSTIPRLVLKRLRPR
jgi:serine/threonine protein kinase